MSEISNKIENVGKPNRMHTVELQLNDSIYQAGCARVFIPRCSQFELTEFWFWFFAFVENSTLSQNVAYWKQSIELYGFNGAYCAICSIVDNPFGNCHIARIKCVHEYFTMYTKWK